MIVDLVIIGCGGFGRETVAVIDSINAAAPRPVWNFLGFVDDSPSRTNLERVNMIGLDLLGATTALVDGPLAQAWFVIAVGQPDARRSIASRLNIDQRAATLVDPTARLGRGVNLGSGTVVAAGAHLATNVHTGLHVHVDRGSQVGHDSEIHDFTTIHPSATVSGQCVIEPAVRVGTGATILPGVRVGTQATIGAAACVTRDAPESSVLTGVPAR